MLVDVGDTRLHVEERGGGDPALIVLQGGPGLDHTMFGRWLDPLGERVRLLLVDERGHGRSDRAPPETWTLAQHAHDVDALATVLGLERYVVLGHSFGASIALQRAVDVSGRPSGTIVSSGIPAERFLAHVEQQLQVFEPVELRALVTASWAREPEARTPEDVATTSCRSTSPTRAIRGSRRCAPPAAAVGRGVSSKPRPRPPPPRRPRAARAPA